ncbi:tRNA threonylcarbamoyladenosine biosynthesis protein TsaE [Chromohalobacter marismortui]|uniref:tRNA threonylcarbamoyladenosine biosynthesis protein TsaE n=1 Tax=Chromohalobacter marismortui TaxID=42055 RepID=A0A4R7NUI2_9GAMM|nr:MULTISPECIES: tRNA (adenosine(37)-N6)-threonylcarbamoyltransferase complex ATPase subunit type 1 TsaE [Chromohalobacter]MCI0510639.1 tRNA (adenosine(37)-N6)-threonylcarbamoyltransferase complex ATPase subunit type 1 TsaE [Chromohalobacter sp.]MCI0591954.1 tRNA (adenosine(37)-N6)-threonylcarbamoyltransferase complex ATPase subunit type 1 TsaE [Chromohalobacter sp.]TDU24784.1 tRNA threonylcarbamoyladenosine biosynthesis protein TsaE [Chromohalobacter marismortui]
MQCFLPHETAHVAFGEALGHALGGRGCVHLEGELGAGKTTLTRGILRAYGHVGAVKSPTYTLVEPYALQGVEVYHFDLYRLGDPEELEFMGARDMLGGGGLSLIEWPSRGKGWLPSPDLVIHLALAGEGRQVTLEGLSPHAEAVMAALSSIRQDKEADA